MKVLHISTSDRTGGAAIAAYRLMEAMASSGIDSRMLVFHKKSDNKRVISIDKFKFEKYSFYARVKGFVQGYFKRAFLNPSLVFSCGFSHVSRVSEIALLRETDVIYIHWVVGQFLNIKDIGKIIGIGKPTFLFLHDMWHLTGGCHCSIDCTQWRNGCKSCPQIKRKMMCRYSSLVLKKKRCWLCANLNVISPSRWLADIAQNSMLFKNVPVFTIPNTLNDKVFRLMDKREARDILNLPSNRRLVLFGAAGGTKNPYKGWIYAEKLMERIAKDADLVMFGGGEEKNMKFNMHVVGRMTDESSLAILYNAVDVFISPTQAESFGQTIAESISCGTKAVVFNVGGVSDIVKHKENGYLAEPNSIDDLERGIKWVFDNPSDEKERIRLHEDIKARFSYPVVAGAHLQVISEVTKYIR